MQSSTGASLSLHGLAALADTVLEYTELDTVPLSTSDASAVGVMAENRLSTF